jgi:hypothetical protein
MLRSTVLTASAAPVTARQANVSQNALESPNATVASPYTAIAQSSTTPRRSMRSTDE